jgi:hypothetical protein
MLAVTPLATWPIVGDVPDLQAIIWNQMATIKTNMALIDAYQTNLNNAQAIPPATATGTATGAPATTLTLTAVVGKIALGATVTGTGMVAGTIVVAQQSGVAGGAGNYTISQASTSSSAALTFTPGGGSSPWPVATDAPTLTLIMQDQAALLRSQNAMIQQYQTLLNDSATTPPGSGP